MQQLPHHPRSSAGAGHPSGSSPSFPFNRTHPALRQPVADRPCPKRGGGLGHRKARQAAAGRRCRGAPPVLCTIRRTGGPSPAWHRACPIQPPEGKCGVSPPLPLPQPLTTHAVLPCNETLWGILSNDEESAPFSVVAKWLGGVQKKTTCPIRLGTLPSCFGVVAKLYPQ